MSSLTQSTIVYPYSDGAPLGESDVHVTLLLWLLHALRTFFEPRRDVQVGGNMFLYYEEGDPKRVICPDNYVAFGVERKRRKSWKTWEEGGVFPQVVIELVSTSSYIDDLGAKKGTYELLGVEEYIVIDPIGETRGPAVVGFRRAAGALSPIVPVSLAPLTLRSEVLGLLFREDAEWGARPLDPATGAALPFPPEEAQARQAEAQARERAEAEVKRLKAEVERLRSAARRGGD